MSALEVVAGDLPSHAAEAGHAGDLVLVVALDLGSGFGKDGAAHENRTGEDEQQRPQIEGMDVEETEVVGDPPDTDADPGKGDSRNPGWP